ncbi:MAG: hypothetical protein WC584_02265 [Candidatus Pacearchaeota archaeon]
MAHEILYRYESKNEENGLTILRVKYNLWDEVPPAKRKDVRSRIKQVGDHLHCKMDFKKNKIPPSIDFNPKEVRYCDYIKVGEENIYLFLGNGLLNRMRLKLNIEAKVLSKTNPEEIIDWKKLEDYLMNAKLD